MKVEMSLLKTIQPPWILILATFFLISTLEVRSEEVNSLITKICLQELNSEMKRAGKETTQEIENFTCNCFINKVYSGSSLPQAHSSCKEEATNRFKL